METKYSGREIALKAQERLALLHDVGHDFRIGKNKIVFKLDGSEVFLLKNCEKTTGNKKTIVECDNCYPVVIYPDSKDKFTELDLERIVVALDSYFIAEVLGKSPKLAICNSYYYVKEGLKPLFRASDEPERDILALMAYEAGNEESMNSALPDKESIVFLFLADDRKVLLTDIDRHELRIIVFDYDGTDICMPDDEDEEVESYVFSYADTPDLALAVSAVTDGYKNITMCGAQLTSYIEPKLEQAEE